MKIEYLNIHEDSEYERKLREKALADPRGPLSDAFDELEEYTNASLKEKFEIRTRSKEKEKILALEHKFEKLKERQGNIVYFYYKNRRLTLWTPTNNKPVSFLGNRAQHLLYLLKKGRAGIRELKTLGEGKDIPGVNANISSGIKEINRRLNKGNLVIGNLIENSGDGNGYFISLNYSPKFNKDGCI